MSNVNVAVLGGNITRDLEMKTMPNGKVVLEFGIANNKNKNKPCFIDCVAYEHTAEFINKFFGKGKAIVVTSELGFEQWEGKEGEKRSKHKLVVRTADFAGGPKDDGGKGAVASTPSPVAEDDIPF